MILTPIFTPPLDTDVGDERPTVQLIDVSFKDNEYHFGFANLKRWVGMCKRSGVEYFEFSHLFTQWGAQHPPKIVADIDGERKRIIGFQLYKFCIKGFLHWGLNFWYSQFSLYPIDPFKVTDAGFAFPSGDAFLVYPGEDGPIDSLRYEVFCEALQAPS